MKRVVHRRTGGYLSLEAAIALAKEIETKHGKRFIDHTSVYGYPTPELAEKATLRPIVESHKEFVFAYIGAVSKGFEGYVVRAICFKISTRDFEDFFPNYVIIG